VIVQLESGVVCADAGVSNVFSLISVLITLSRKPSTVPQIRDVDETACQSHHLLFGSARDIYDGAISQSGSCKEGLLLEDGPCITYSPQCV
jgi:hypothetical protein